MNSRALILLISIFGLGCMALASAAESNDAKATYTSVNAAAASQYKIQRLKCDALAGNSKDVCVVEAKAAEKRSVAEAMATYKGTDKARASARKDIADANFDVAKTTCQRLTGNDKDVCVKEAKSAHIAAIDDARADKKIADIRNEVKEDKMDAEYNVAREKCDGLAGKAKDVCVKQAKTRFNK